MISFNKFIDSQLHLDYYIDLMNRVDYLYENNLVYPPKEKLFRVFDLCELNAVKVVIIGQDPYIDFDQADGVAFSINSGKITPSLKNIYLELYNDLGIKRTSTILDDWVEQGVLLFNCIMSVNAKDSLSHKNIGWEIFCSNLLTYLDNSIDGIIFVFWGNYAKQYKKFVKNGIVIESSHPSPLGAYRGFIGSKPFSTINNYLMEQNKEVIKW